MISFVAIKQKLGPYAVGLAVLGGGILVFGVAMILFAKQQEVSAEGLVKDGELTSLLQRQAIVTKMQSSKNALIQYRTILDNILVSEPSVPAVMDQIQQIAGESGIVLTALQFSPGGSDRTATTSVKLQASVTGPYTGIQTFLKGLENSGRLLIVDSLRFSATAKQATAEGVDTTTTSVSVTLGISNPFFGQKGSASGSAFDPSDPAFVKLMETLKTYKIYLPRAGGAVVGKPNPFQP